MTMENENIRVAKNLKDACASMMPKTDTSGDDAAEEWSIPVKWVESPAIKAEQREVVGV